MGLLSSIAGIFGAKADTHAAKNTITNYTNAGNNSIAQYNQSLDASRQINSPLYDVGLSGARGANAMLQPGYDFQSSDPSYQWRLNQGLQGVQSSAAANGLLNSGGAMKALNNYAQGAASGEFNNEFTRRNVMAGYAQPAANALTNSYYNTANGIKNASFDMVQGVSAGDAAKASGLGAQYGGFANLGDQAISAMFGVPSGFSFNPSGMAGNYGGIGAGGNPFANASLGSSGANPFSISPNTLNSLPSF